MIFHLNPALVGGGVLVSLLLLWNATVLDSRGHGRRPALPLRLAGRELVCCSPTCSPWPQSAFFDPGHSSHRGP